MFEAKSSRNERRELRDQGVLSCQLLQANVLTHQIPVVTVYHLHLTISIYGFHMILRLNNINQLFFAMETRCIYFGIGTGFLDIIWFKE